MSRNMRSLVVVTAVATLLWSSPVAAKSHIPLWGYGSETVSSVTPSTLIVKHQAGLEQKLPMSQITVQAAIYPATAGILRPGERVTVFQESDARPLVVVHPEAYGTLAHAGSMWTVHSKRHGTVSITGSNPQLLGMRQWHSGDKVMVFGASVGNHKVDASAVAAVPLMARSTVQSLSNNALTLKSDDYGVLSYSLSRLPAPLRQHFSAITPGQSVIASLDPLTRQVLMVWPDHKERWARTLERGSAGQVVAVSSKDLTLTNHLGTVTIPLNHSVTVQWPGHQNAHVSEIKPGARVMILRDHDGSLKIMVLTQ